MDKVCQQHGVACVTGTNPDTGVVGLSTHGGAGYLSRQYGLAADNFVAAEVVTASGAIVHATPANEHKDLLWAVAGGGSNFGVITALTMKAHPMDHVYGRCTQDVGSVLKASLIIIVMSEKLALVDGEFPNEKHIYGDAPSIGKT